MPCMYASSRNSLPLPTSQAHLHNQSLHSTSDPHEPSSRQQAGSSIPLAAPPLQPDRVQRTHIEYLLLLAVITGKDSEAQDDLETGDADTDDDEEDDDPGDARHFLVVDAVGENFAQVEEDLASFVEHLNARLDFEVFAHGRVQWVQRGFRVPEETGRVEHVGGWVERVSGAEIGGGGREQGSRAYIGSRLLCL
jgi:hypothetical protein